MILILDRSELEKVFLSLKSSPSSQTLSNACCTSKNIPEQYFLFSKEFRIQSIIRWHCSGELI